MAQVVFLALPSTESQKVVPTLRRRGVRAIEFSADYRLRDTDESTGLTSFDLPGELARYLVEKGSITVDGVSLTVVEVANEPVDNLLGRVRKYAAAVGGLRRFWLQDR